MDFLFACNSDVGIQKKTNQDSCCMRQAETDKGNILFALICDGMGGLSKGELASATLIKVFSDWFENNLPLVLSKENPLDEIKYIWNRLMKQQNQIISSYGKNLDIQLGSTITAFLILEDGQYLIGHVGDTRVYRITDQSTDVLTEDQTLVQREVNNGRLAPELAEQDPRRNVLLQCVGASKVVEPAFYEGTVERNECYLLCSDGFRHEVTTEEITENLSPSANSGEQDMCDHIQKLIDLNKFRHENDNITAMLIKTV